MASNNLKKILLFTGAGMSVPLGLPAANGFTETCKKCDAGLMSLLTGHLGSKVNDIEQLLYVVEEFVEESKFLKFIIATTGKRDGSFSLVENALNTHIHNARQFKQVIKHDIYKILQDFNKDDARFIYINLIKSLKNIYGEIALSVFTTNYDIVLEDVFDEYDTDFSDLGFSDLYLGFILKRVKRVFDPNEDFEWSTNIIEYNKLHGSLDWVKDNNGNLLKTGTVTQPANPQDMPLLYPGYKGTPIEEPFITIHNKLYKRLIECDKAIVIGFAFRDPYINSIFEFVLRARPDIIIECYNPALIEDLPEESGIKNFIKNFPKSFKYIPEKIEILDPPLKLK